MADKKYTTIILSKEAVKKLSTARDKWKEENKNFSQIGLGPFALQLLDFYETHKK